MKLAVLSDVHGNLPALQAVLHDLRRHDISGVIVAGDFIGGPQPNETIRLLQSLNPWMIRGNSDDNLLSYHDGSAPQGWYSSRQFGLLRWSHRHIDKDILEFLQSLPEQRVIHVPGTAPIRLVHGSHRRSDENIFPDRQPAFLDKVFEEVHEPVFVCGHTHIPWKVERPTRLALNPGAVCGPLNSVVGAQYALLSWQDGRWQASHRLVEYDLGQIRAAFHESGLLEEGGALARSFLLSIETGQNVAMSFLDSAYRLAAEAGFGDHSVVPDDIWEQAAASFDWQSPT